MKARLAIALCLLAATASADTFRRFRKNGVGNSSVVLRFLPSGDAALANECSGTVPTGTKGETLTFSRGSSATCTKSDGTVVTLTSNQPRVNASGLLVEEARTNTLLRSEALDFNGAGVWQQQGASPPVVTANFGTSPDGTSTAEQLAFTTTGNSYIFQGITTTAAAWTYSIYMRTVSGGTSFWIGVLDADGATWSRKQCTATSSWSRCTFTITNTAGTTYITIGRDTADAGQTSLTDGTFLLWGAQAEAGAFATSYIATAGTSVARSADVASFAVPSGASNSAGCLAATLSGWQGLASAFPRVLDFDASNPMYVSAATSAGADDGTNGVGQSLFPSLFSTTTRIKLSWSGSSFTLTVPNAGGGTGTNTYDGSLWSTATLYLGSQGGASDFINGYLSDIQFGKTSGACP